MDWSTAASPDEPDRSTVLVVNATFDDLVLVRLVTGGVGAAADMSVDCLEDLRLVVDEACALLLETYSRPDSDDPGRLSLTFDTDVDRGVIEVRVERSGVVPAGQPSEVTTMVLDSLTSTWSTSYDGSTAAVRLRLPLLDSDDPAQRPAGDASPPTSDI
jgi:hypothetical protein